MGGRSWKIRTGNPNLKLTIFEKGLVELRTNEAVYSLLESTLNSTAPIAGSKAEVRRSTKAQARAKVTLTNGQNTSQEAANGVLFAALSATGAKIGKKKKDNGLE
jgi:hypothetical protein